MLLHREFIAALAVVLAGMAIAGCGKPDASAPTDSTAERQAVPLSKFFGPIGAEWTAGALTPAPPATLAEAYDTSTATCWLRSTAFDRGA
jgi:hypothetical protein